MRCSIILFMCILSFSFGKVPSDLTTEPPGRKNISSLSLLGISLKKYSFTLFSAEILCNFQANICDWDKKPDNATFMFHRHSANQLENSNMTGPDQDYMGDKKGRFMIASIYRDNATVENEFAWLRSPLYKSSEHPIECFNFWFNFGVRYSKNFLSFDVTNLL